METQLRRLGEIVEPVFITKIVRAKTDPDGDFRSVTLRRAYSQNMIVQPETGSELRIQDAHVTSCGNIWTSKNAYDCDF